MTASPPLLRRPAIALALTSSLILAACSGSGSGSGPRTQRADVAFTGCDKVACEGILDGAKYQILLPKTWNGTLLLYSHGYRSEQATPPEFNPPQDAAVPAPTEEVGKALLDQGYALAGSGYASNGWAVQDGVKAGEKLYAFFADKVAQPDRTLVWGDSLGGLITETLAEKDHDWIDGAAPLCGVLAGANANFDLGLDLGVTVKALIDPTFQVTGYATYQDATDAWSSVAAKVQSLGSDLTNGVPAILFAAALLDAPSKTSNFDGSDITSQVKAKAESLLVGLGLNTYGRFELESRVGGNPSTNVGVDYASRISPAERALIEAVSPGATDRMLALVSAEPRIEADPTAREKADALGDPTGELTVPTITLHTTADPLVLVQNEGVFAQRVQAAKSRDADLLQLYTSAPASYQKAPYGAGHCNFTTDERLGVIGLLDSWVTDGIYPTVASAQRVFGDPSGLAPGYQPGPWPGLAEDVPALPSG